MRRAIRAAVVVAVGLLVAPTLALAAPRGTGGGARFAPGGTGGGARFAPGVPRASAGHANHGWGGPRWQGWSGHGHGGWHGGHSHGGWHGGHSHGGCCWGWGGVAVGVAAGALLTAPLWAYPQVYAAPAYPVYAPPPAYPAYSAYPTYSAYPAYPAAYPAYTPGATYITPAEPPPGVPAPPPPDASALPPTPQAAETPSGSPPHGTTSAAAPPENCETLTVAGHWETRTFSNGQRLSVWVPTYTRSVCR